MRGRWSEPRLASLAPGPAGTYRRAVSLDEPAAPIGTHTGEPHAGALGARLNWLRAGVLGANDGIVSTAGLVVGVAGATTAQARCSPPGSPAWSPGRCPWRWASTSR